MADIDIICRDLSHGWIPMAQLAKVAADVFGTKIRRTETSRANKFNMMRNVYLPNGARASSSRGALIIATDPDDVARFMREPDLLRDYKEIAVYICDSFAVHKITRPAIFKHVDLVVRMRPFDEDFYRDLVGDRTIFSPFGADVLSLGGWEGARNVDVLRIGRQPEEWEDDEISQARLANADLSFAGRPPFGKTADEGMAILFDHYRRSKVTLAHSNLICGHLGTHKHYDYVTARWTDAAANGTIVAGHQPTQDRTLYEDLWPELLIHFESRDPQENIEQLAEVVQGWTPEMARYNYMMALQKLDWRWRLKEIADHMGWAAPGLETGLAKISKRVADLKDAA